MNNEYYLFAHLVGIVRERREREREDKAAWYGRRE
jgi:hypothetical protein